MKPFRVIGIVVEASVEAELVILCIALIISAKSIIVVDLERVFDLSHKELSHRVIGPRELLHSGKLSIAQTRDSKSAIIQVDVLHVQDYLVCFFAAREVDRDGSLEELGHLLRLEVGMDFYVVPEGE